jgi:lysophospholipase L1-like esterase
MTHLITPGRRPVLLLAILVACILPAMARAATAAPIRVACVGDSITWGYTITHHRLMLAWPGVLQHLVGRKIESRDFGHNGATMLKKGNLPYWTTPEYKAATKFDPNIVIIMLGTNDTKPKNWKKYGSQFTANAIAMIHHFRHLKAHPKIYICTPPPVAHSTWGINEPTLVHGVIPAIKAAARATHIQVIHVHQLMLKRITKPLADYFARDGVHPNPAGQAIMGRIIAQAVFLRR